MSKWKSSSLFQLATGHGWSPPLAGPVRALKISWPFLEHSTCCKGVLTLRFSLLFPYLEPITLMHPTLHGPQCSSIFYFWRCVTSSDRKGDTLTRIARWETQTFTPYRHSGTCHRCHHPEYPDKVIHLLILVPQRTIVYHRSSGLQ